MAAGTLTPSQLNAGAGLLQNQGMGINPALVAAVNAYTGTALISELANTLAVGSAGNVGNTILSNTVISNLTVLAANTCSALSNSVPPGYAIVANVVTGFAGVVLSAANQDAGSGDVSKLCQAISIAQGYRSLTNDFINSAVNSQTYLGSTFTSMNSLITGDITSVNLATQAFAQDLANLGSLINLRNLDNFGSPLALLQQIVQQAGVLPTLSFVLLVEGVPEEIALNLDNPTTSVTDSVQKTMYRAMTKVTGDVLQEVLTLLNVTTPNIETMADLLNPLKLFPNSFQSLTAPTASGPRAIYVDSQGTVNSKLKTELPAYVLNTVS